MHPQKPKKKTNPFPPVAAKLHAKPETHFLVAAKFAIRTKTERAEALTLRSRFLRSLGEVGWRRRVPCCSEIRNTRYEIRTLNAHKKTVQTCMANERLVKRHIPGGCCLFLLLRLLALNSFENLLAMNGDGLWCSIKNLRKSWPSWFYVTNVKRKISSCT
jgi:hypothetical protein